MLSHSSLFKAPFKHVHWDAPPVVAPLKHQDLFNIPFRHINNRRDFRQPIDTYGVRTAIKDKNVNFIVKNAFDHSFDDFASQAYSAPSGVAIRTNPVTGETEMFVSGSRTVKDWYFNAIDAGEGLAFGPVGEIPIKGNQTASPGSAGNWLFNQQYKKAYVAYLEHLARRNHVDVVYAHSRGYSYVDEMKVPGISKLGLDGAVVTRRGRKSYTWNLKQRNFLDSYLGRRRHPQGWFDRFDHRVQNPDTTIGKRNYPYVHLKDKPLYRGWRVNNRYHRVWRDYSN